MMLKSEIIDLLICPSTNQKLVLKDNYLVGGKNKYPIINDIPILINESNSLFKIDDFKNKGNIFFNLNRGIFETFIKLFYPTISLNIKSKTNYKKISKMLNNKAKILVIGGSVKGKGIEYLYKHHTNIIESDVHFGPETKVIFDAHDIPFKNESFDCVIIQAVLEHVLNPQRCVDEIYRVLSKEGLIYSETPFIQQVHMKEFDFTRFTYLGHRRLFKQFNLIESAPCCGPGMALAWSFAHFLKSFTNNAIISKIIMKISYLFLFPLKYFDYFLINSKGSYDAASAYYFIGTKSDKTLTDNQLIGEYKGFI